MPALIRAAVAEVTAMVELKMVMCVCVLGTAMEWIVSLKIVMVTHVWQNMCRIALGMERACTLMRDDTTAHVRKAMRPHTIVE